MKKTLIIGTVLYALGFGHSVTAATADAEVNFTDVEGHWAKVASSTNEYSGWKNRF